MGQYVIEYTENALNDLKFHKKSGDKSVLKKIDKLIDELKIRPFLGTGQP
jgi:toxin YoeB